MVGMLQHPHILPIYDAGEENGRCYIVTEHVHGARTLSAYCRPDNLLRVDDVVEIMYKCAKALHYAHSAASSTATSSRRTSCSRRITTCASSTSASRWSRFGDLAHRRHRRQSLVHVAGAGAVASSHPSLRPVFARRGDVRAADRLPAVPRRQPRQAAAPDRLRDAAADPHAAQGHSRGPRGHVAKAMQKDPAKRHRTAWSLPPT